MLRKNFKFYFIIWAVAFAMFNAIAFLREGNIERLEDGGWIGYGFIVAGYLIQLGCAYYALAASDATKTFYRISLVDTGYATLCAMTGVGLLCMFINIFPIWLAALLCMSSLAVNIVAIVKAAAAASYAENVDKKIKAQTQFIRILTVNAEGVIARANSAEVKAAAEKVYEAVRYSDPMSSDALSGVESQITIRFSAFSDAVAADNTAEAQRIAEELVILIGDRNKTCKLLK